MDYIQVLQVLVGILKVGFLDIFYFSVARFSIGFLPQSSLCPLFILDVNVSHVFLKISGYMCFSHLTSQLLIQLDRMPDTQSKAQMDKYMFSIFLVSDLTACTLLHYLRSQDLDVIHDILPAHYSSYQQSEENE